MRGIRPRWLRMELYRRVLELRRQGLSYKQIQQRIFEEASEWLSKSIISYWINRVHTPLHNGIGRIDEDRRAHKLRPCPELAYVIGAALGDGSVQYEAGRYHYAIILRVKDYDFAKEFGRCAAIALGRQRPYKPFWSQNDHLWVVKTYSKELYNLLRRPVKIERVKVYVEHSRECMTAFIRGLADAEGNVEEDPENLGHIRIGNSNLCLLEYVASLSKILGITARIYKKKLKENSIIHDRVIKRRKTIYELIIYRKSEITKFRDLVGFAIRRKQKILSLVG